MTTFTIHNLDSAPAESKPFLQAAKDKFGMVPNLIGLLGEAPNAVEAYLTMSDLFSKSSFSPTERTVVWLTIIFDNNCDYCMVAHTAIGGMEGVDASVMEAIREGRHLADARLEALRQFTSAMVIDRGWAGAERLEAFFAAGYTQQNVLEVIVGIAHKTLSNYANHIAATPVDAPFQKFTWSKGTAVAH